MKVLIACEFSGIIRTEFEKLGCVALSADLLPSERPGNHYQGNVLDIINENWDLIIGHPPCNYISFAGNAYNNRPERIFKRLEGLEFFAKLLFAPAPFICIENPLGFAGQTIRKPDQTLHPYYFGEPAKKRTCLWLKGLPALQHNRENNLFEFATHCKEPDPIYIDKKGKKRYYTDAISGRNKKERSRSFKSIGEAMARQWVPFIKEKMNL